MTVSADEGCPIHAGELRALVRVDQHALLGLAPPYRHVQHDIGGLPALHRPTHHAAGIKIDHDGQIGKALQGADVGDVRHPGPVWRSHVELAIQGVVDRQGRLANKAPGPPLVADLRLEAREPRSTAQRGSDSKPRPDPPRLAGARERCF